MRTSQKGATLAEFLVVACIFAVVAVVAVTSLSLSDEYIILKAPTYTSGDSPWVEFEVRPENGGSFTMRVPVGRVEVSLRTDSEKCASLMCRDAHLGRNTCKSATILVPKEDVVAWQAEVNRWKALRKSPHVVPKPPSDNR